MVEAQSHIHTHFSKTGFVGGATIAQAKLFNDHPTGKVLKEERLHALMGDGGIQ